MSTEKRLFLFLVLTFTVLAGYAALVEMYGPKKPPPQAAGEKAKEQPAVPKADQPAEPPTTADKADSDKGDKPAVEALEKDDQRPATHPHRVVSLGSYRPAAGNSPLLITLNSRGAALERVELVGRVANGDLRYIELDDTSGYLGNLSLEPTGDRGCRIHTVPSGSPAALARGSDSQATSSGNQPADGLQVNDTLMIVNETAIESAADLETELHKLKPGNTVKLTVERTIEGQAKRLHFIAKLDVKPFQLVKPEPLRKGELTPHPDSLLLSIKQADNDQPKFLDALRNVEWETVVLNEPSPGVEFRYAVAPAMAKAIGLAGPIEVIKRYRLGKNPGGPAESSPGSHPAYHIDFEIELRNTAAQPQSLVYRLDGTNGLPTEGWWYLTKINPHWFQSAGARDVVLRTDSDGHRLIGCSAIHSRSKSDEKSPRTPLFSEKEPTANRSLAHIGVDTQYFAAALIPDDGKPGSRAVFSRAEALVWGDVLKIPKWWERTANASYQLTSEPINVDPGVPFVQQFQLFAGPKDPDILARYGLGDWIYYGWFGWIAQGLSWLLHFFYAICGNYGIAIILLTVLVRSCMFPVSRTAARNAAMMQELAPEMRKIAEKHKTNLEARGKAQQELFRQHNYNPLGGCWLMFLQLPVFIGLYRCLAVDIELRQAPLIPGIEWSSNLAGPDKLFYWKNEFLSWFTDEGGWLGPYFNLLPIFTILLFLLHQKLFTPPATDEQTEMQMKMMKIMTVIMGVLFYKVPAGLCLYFITSSLWGIAERKLLPAPTPKKKDEGGGGGGGGSKLASLFGPRKPPPPENGNARKKELERKLRKNK